MANHTCFGHSSVGDPFSSEIFLMWNDTREVLGNEGEEERNLPFLFHCFGLIVLLYWYLRPPQKCEVVGEHVGVPLLIKKTICLVAGLAALPVVTFAMPFVIIYRFLIHIWLKITVGSDYKGLLHGPDVIWAMETPEARSIINILAMMNIDKSEPAEVLELFQQAAKETLLHVNSPYPKLKHIRQKSRLGYYYWKSCPDIDVANFVKNLPFAGQNMDETALKECIGNYCNKPMPLNDTGTWEILVGQQPVITKYPVVFRVHHAVGDGVALVRILLEGLAQFRPRDLSQKRKSWAGSHITKRPDFVHPPEKPLFVVSPTFTKCIGPKKNMALNSPEMKSIFNGERLRSLVMNLVVVFVVCVVCVKRSLQILLRQTCPLLISSMKFVFSSPYVIMHQVVGTTEDTVLYGRQLSGEKVISWYSDDHFLTKIRQIKGQSNVKFTHVLFTSLSRSLQKFYLFKTANPPRSINVVLPARVDYDDLTKGLQTTSKVQVGKMTARVTRLYETTKNMKPEFSPHQLSFASSTDSDSDYLQKRVDKLHEALSKPLSLKNSAAGNKFTVAMINLPIPTKGSLYVNDLAAVQKRVENLRNSPDYMINYWLLRWVAHLMPVPFLKPFLANAPCSLVLSNLPGPQETVELCGYPIESILFWVPNRGLNGVGIGMLSYRGRFSLGLMADKSLMTSAEADLILSGIIDDINGLVSS